MLHNEFTVTIARLAEASITHPKLRAAVRLGWAVEEALHRGTDGREYLVPTSEDDEWTITLGHGDVVTELPYSIDPSTADAVAIVRSPDGDPSADPFSRVEWVGLALDLHPERPLGEGRRLVGTVSIRRLGELLSAAFVAVRPGTGLIYDPGWSHHRNPLMEMLTPRR